MSGLPDDLAVALERSPPDDRQVADLVERRLRPGLDDRGRDPRAILAAPALLERIARILDGAAPAAYPAARFALLRCELLLAAHAVAPYGADAGLVARYRAFRARHARSLFAGVLDWTRTRIEDDLLIAQHLLFNDFRFAEVEEHLGADLALYEDLVAAAKRHDPDDACAHDDLHARLRGTLGQAHGFLADLAPDAAAAGAHATRADRLLREDLDALPAGGPPWIQGCNYLSSLAWRREDLAGALRWLGVAVGHERPMPAGRLLRLHGSGALVPAEHPQRSWLLLNQLRLTALALRRREATPGEDWRREADGLAAGLSGAYPDLLLLKWLAVIHAMAGLDAADAAGTLLARCGPEPGPGAPVLCAMRASALHLVAVAAGPGAVADRAVAGARSAWRRAAACPGIAAALGGGPWASALAGPEPWTADPYPSALAPPYYFA